MEHKTKLVTTYNERHQATGYYWSCTCGKKGNPKDSAAFARRGGYGHEHRFAGRIG